MTDFLKESLAGPVLEQAQSLHARAKSLHTQAKSLWRELTSPVSADFIGVPHAGHAETATEMREPHRKEGEADFADYYRWMQL